MVSSTVIRRSRLTEKQERFANLVATGMSGAEAYVQAYDCTGKRSTARANASHLMANTAIAQRVAELRAAQIGALAYDGARLREHTITRLLEESSTELNRSAVARVRALELLGRMDIVCLFGDKRAEEKSNPRTPEEIERELVEALSAFAER